MGVSTQTTPEGTKFTTTGNRAVFPTPDHKHGGGVALTDSVVSEILAFPGGGHDDETQTEWEATGNLQDTRIGDSKEVRITQTSFGRERTVTVTLVDVADANVEATND